MTDIERTLSVFCVPGQVVTIQALYGPRKARSFCTRELTEAARIAAEMDASGPVGTYFGLNPVQPDFAGTVGFPKNEHIPTRYWLPIDFDPVRPSGTSSTEAESEAAWDALCRCQANLSDMLNPVIASSGNGWQLCYPIHLPNDEPSRDLVRDVLKALAVICDDPLTAEDKALIKAGSTLPTPKAALGVECHDAKRIWALYGTTKRKGTPTAERPHRLTQLVDGEPWDKQDAEENVRLLKDWLARNHWADDQRKNRPGGDILARAKAYIAKEPPAISGQGGHNRTYHVACVLVKDFGLTPAQAFEAIQDWNRTCVPPWSEKELWHKIHDAVKKEGPVGKLAGQPQAGLNGHAQTATPASPTSDAPEPWGKPIPLNTLPSASPFPLHVFPETLRSYVQNLAWATNAPIDFAAVPLLVTAAGAIGNTRRLAITQAHRQPSCLFAAVIGRPGSGKSTPQDAVTHPVQRWEHHTYVQWKKDVKEWEDDESSPKPPKPRLRRAMLDDTTIEAMVRILEDNPRGLLMSRDELAALITGMNQYKDGGKGNDRQNWLKIWSGKRIEVDRKSFEGVPLIVSRPCVSVIGGIQPQVIECMRGEQRGDRPPPDDGFLDRFLLCYPEPLPAVGETWRDVSEGDSAIWAVMVQQLLNLTMFRHEGDEIPQLMPFTDTARIAWAQLTQQHADEVNNDLADWLWGPWAKLVPGYAGRFALILQLIHNPDARAVDGSYVEWAFDLVNYFKSHAKKVYTVMSADPRVQEANHILNWLTRKPDVKVFSRRDAYVDLRRSFNNPEALERPLKFLCEHRHLRPLDVTRPGPGQKPAPKYEVNPLWRHTIHGIHGINPET